MKKETVYFVFALLVIAFVLWQCSNYLTFLSDVGDAAVG